MNILEKLNLFDTRKIALFIGVVQGLLLLILFELRSLDIYISLYLGVFIIVLVVPITIALTLETDLINSKSYWKTIRIFSIVTFLLAFYFGLKQDANTIFQTHKWANYNAGSFFVTFCIGWFIFLLFFQSILRDKRLISSYESQFDNSWNNFLTIVLSYLFLSLLWGILFLWAQLFKTIGIDVFETIFTQNWFYIPVTTTGLVYFIDLLKSRVDAIGTIRRILQSLFHFLLPLTLLMAILFAAVMLFLGVDTFWDSTRSRTLLLLWITSLGLYLFNAVYQSGDEVPYGPKLNKIIRYSLCVFIIFMAMSWYGLSSRISQYGWTVNLAHGAIVAAILSCYVLSYSAINFLRQSKWQYLFRGTNSLIAIFIGVICITLNTPILNLEKITVNQHMQRFTAGEIGSSELDLHYLARKSSSYGRIELEKLKKDDKYRNQTKLQEHIIAAEKKYYNYDRYALKTAPISESREKLRIVPSDAKIPESILNYLSDQLKSKQCFREKKCSLIMQDLNKDSVPEYIFINGSGGSSSSFMLTLEGAGQNEKDKITRYRINYSSSVTGLNSLSRDFDKGVKITTQTSTWQDLMIGEKRFIFDSHRERDRH